MDLRDYLHVVRRNWLIIVLIALLSLVIALTYTLLQIPEYQSTAKVFVSSGTATTLADLNQGGAYTQQVVQSYADVATTPYVLNPVIRDLKLHTNAESLARQVDATAPPGRVVLQLTVTDRSASRAAAVANAIAKRLTTAVVELTPSTQNASSSVKITQIQPATPSLRPASPDIVFNLLLGLVIGLVVGFAGAMARQALDTRIHGSNEISGITEKPVVGRIAFDPDAKEHPLVALATSHGIRAEAFKTLRTNLQFLEFPSNTRSIVITSSVESEGKSTTATNLALTIAVADQTVVVVDADLRRPTVSEYLGIDGSVGLTDVLIGEVKLEDALQRWGDNGLYVLPAGRTPPNPSELLQSRAMSDLVQELRARFSTAVFDAPPLLPVADAAILARQTDGAVVVSAMRKVRKPQLRSALNVLANVDARVLGLVLTMVPTKGPDAYGYGYGAGYGYGYSAQPSE